ncbi:hypothetical protein [Thermospira aquatica]|uniref:YkuD domain-containing protein n=1 Tax=Thermospira aquatica TaxID=2828656 RepID=A0AAX3BAP0_9SPIR|nr:hypothetical protein [Thermospira aquatica]URA09138.1 hypothetical protein KDW03_06410 [Thermospira aquatica]
MVSHNSQWNWSHGCQTIYRDDFEEFAELFGGEKKEEKQGKTTITRWEFKEYGVRGKTIILTQ